MVGCLEAIVTGISWKVVVMRMEVANRGASDGFLVEVVVSLVEEVGGG